MPRFIAWRYISAKSFLSNGSPPVNTKKTLPDAQFIRMCGAIQKGDYTIEKAKKEFALTDKQIVELKNIEL